MKASRHLDEKMWCDKWHGENGHDELGNNLHNL